MNTVKLMKREPRLMSNNRGKNWWRENIIPQISPSQTQSWNRNSWNFHSVQCKRLNKRARERERERERERNGAFRRRGDFFILLKIHRTTSFKTKLKPYHPYILIGERERERERERETVAFRRRGDFFILLKIHRTTPFKTKLKPYHPYLLIETPNRIFHIFISVSLSHIRF